MALVEWSGEDGTDGGRTTGLALKPVETFSLAATVAEIIAGVGESIAFSTGKSALPIKNARDAG
ncbi:hypothetical protein [Reyranella soli]|nr:hypothetical protein [Reyranella soli]